MTTDLKGSAVTFATSQEAKDVRSLLREDCQSTLVGVAGGWPGGFVGSVHIHNNTM